MFLRLVMSLCFIVQDSQLQSREVKLGCALRGGVLFYNVMAMSHGLFFLMKYTEIRKENSLMFMF